MPTLLEELRNRLLRAGVAPRHVARYVTELAEHFEDLLLEEKRTTTDSEAAERSALKRLGNLETLTQAMVARSELHSWSLRAPWAVFILGPMLVLLCCVFASSCR